MQHRITRAVCLVVVAATTAACQDQPKGKQAGSPATSTGVRKVDATTFLLAFRQGKGAQYKGYVVVGEGVEYHGRVTISDKSGKEERELILTIAILGSDNKPAPVITEEDLMSADVDLKPMLQLKIRGPDVQFKPQPSGRRDPKPVYSFSGTFEGSTEQRSRQAVPIGMLAESFQIPILNGGVVK